MLSFTKNRDQPQNRQVCLTTPIIERIDLGGASNLMLVLISLIVPAICFSK
jgi:hypothetical protein